MSTKDRGLASMPKDRVRAISSLGGKAAHKAGTAHRWTPGPDGTAASAGRKGGLVSGHRWTSEMAAEAGRKGGKARAKRKASRAQ